MTRLRWVAVTYAAILVFVAVVGHIPGTVDAQGRIFGIFRLTIYNDVLHLSSAVWAGVAAWWSRRASKIFLQYFGFLYFVVGMMGLITGSGYLDLGIINYGWQDLPIMFKIFANTPHITLGGCALLAARLLDQKQD